MTKICPKCGMPKPLSEYCKRRPPRKSRAGWCKACSNAAVRAYRATAKGKVGLLAYAQSARGKGAHCEWMRKRRKNDPAYRLRRNVSLAVFKAIKATGRSKAGKATFDHLSYTAKQLKAHLESLWEPWMNWSSYGFGAGKWCIDHMIPHSAFYYTAITDAAFRECWALSNLRPLGIIENLHKGARLELSGGKGVLDGK